MNIRVTVGKRFHRYPLCFLGGYDRFYDARTGAEGGEGFSFGGDGAEHKNRENTLAYKERM